MTIYDAYGGGRIDFSPLADIGKNIGDAIGDYRVKRDVQSAWEQAGGDYRKAASALLAKGRIRSAAALANLATEQSLAENKAVAAVPDDIRLLEWWRNQGGQQPQSAAPEPMRMGPAEPSGTPGVSVQSAPAGLETAPALLQQKFLPLQDQKRLEAAGTGEGQRESQRAGMKEAAPNVQALVDNLVGIAKEADPGTFENALGPLQGAPDAETWQGAIGQFFPQTAGAVANYFDKGMKEGFVDWKTGNIKGPGDLSGGFTSTLRSKINGTQAALVSFLQRVQRVQGIGSQSDYELRQIINQVGDLNKSRNKEDFYDRLATVVSNMKASGIPIEMPEGAPTPQTSGKQFSERYDNQAATPTMDMASEPPQGTVQGSAVDTGQGIPGRGAPPVPNASDTNKLVYLMHNAPPEVVKQKMDEFDKLYNWPGLASIILGQARAGR